MRGGSDISCPDEAIWMEVAAGLSPSGAQSEELLAHSASCAQCAAALARSVRTLSSEAFEGEDEIIRTLKSSGRKWRRQTAERIAGPSVGRRAWPRQAWLAVAAAVVGCGVLTWKLAFAPAEPLRLLAEAYTAQRTVELRIPGAAYGPLRLQRGARSPRSDRPAELSETDAAIRRHLDAKPSDPLWLWTKGRADLLDWSYDDAIRNLSLALDLHASANAPVKAKILVDLATAYFQRGEVENRAIDYNMAADKLGQAIQYDGALAVAFFNRALVYEKIPLYPAAIADWKRYLTLDSHGEWAMEARRRLADLERKMKAANPDGGRLDDLAEVQLEQAMIAGLASGSLNELAARMSEENHDRWLLDALQTPPTDTRSILKSMVATRTSLRLDQFPRELERLQAISRQGLPDADRVWLEFERLFRIGHSPQVANCVKGVDDLIALCRRRQYAWFLARSLLERSSCEMASGNLASSESSDREAMAIAVEHQLPATRLRAAGYLDSRMIYAGQYREAADLERESLELFWSRPFPPARGQQFYNDMDFASEALGRLHAAKAAAEMAAAMAHAGGLIISEAVNRARWAGSAERLGLRDEAAEQYARSKALFDQLERNPFSDEYRAYAETFAAKSSGDHKALVSFQESVGSSTNPLMVVPYLRTMAEFDVRDGRFALAQSRLEDAIGRMERGAQAPRNRGERRRQRMELQRVYRQLALAKLRNNDSTGAYVAWQRMLKSDDELQGLLPAEPAGLSTGAPAVLLTFARLDSRYALWVRRDGGLSFRWIEGDAESIDRLARQYSALCSQSKAAMPELREVGAQLRFKLLDSALSALPAESVLLVQPDGDLARLPWAALPLSSGVALARKYLVATAPLPATYPGAIRLPNVVVRRALIAGAPTLNPSRAADYPPLPNIEQELEAVRGAYPNSDLLQGPTATSADIDRYLRSDDALHFTGHAAVTSEGIRLLTAPDPAAKDREAAEGLWKPGKDGLRLGLAVLSACSTARFEEVESPEPRDLATALLLGGARQVVATLWNVDSQASTRFMEAFYREMHLGGTTPDAMRKAWRAVSEQPGMTNPYYWAGFSLFVQI
jgi:CHAT domain-containing protein/tetratricopeptide (TPR) repeat protein